MPSFSAFLRIRMEMEACTVEKPCPLGTDTEKPTAVCFVCTGNTCRSPMAAAVLNALGKGEYKAVSAGISAIPGDMISENSVSALKKAGIESTPDNDYENHRAVQISDELAERCDKIVAISKSHFMALICAFPQYAERITVMPRDIADPFLRGEEVYDECLRQITECVKEMFAV